VLPNPGGGNTVIVSYTDHNIVYQRGNSRICVAFKDLYEAYKMFRGGILDSTKLREYKPWVFDSKRGGHSCNCTFLFMVLRAIGVVDTIAGAGKKGDPFWVKIPENMDC
jgi:hypothetical protein